MDPQYIWESYPLVESPVGLEVESREGAFQHTKDFLDYLGFRLTGHLERRGVPLPSLLVVLLQEFDEVILVHTLLDLQAPVFTLGLQL